MKETDVMLGDWVACHGTYRRIQSLEFDNTEEEKCWFWSDEDNALCLLSEHDPIPLTPEILEKNGFLYKKLTGIGGDSEIWRLADDYFDIDMYEWSDSIWVFRYDCIEMSLPHTQVTMSYVHELQRALKDCGIEKEIVL